MLTLDEARAMQKSRQKKSPLKFFVLAVLIASGSVFVFLCTDIIALSSVFYLLPLPFLLLAVKLSEITRLFAPKEFQGEVVSVRVYIMGASKTKGAGRGHGPNTKSHYEAELLLKDKKGKALFKTFWNGDVTSHLRPGDEIAVLRFIDEPILIRGEYWESSI